MCFDDKLYALMNYHKPEKWLEFVNDNGHGLQSKNILTDLEKLEEILMMGMRLEAGITDEKFHKYLGKNFADVLNISEIERLVKSGFVKFDGIKLALTDKGLLMHSSVVAAMLV
jgi:oxygen-independent coproporphyrinogen-3 oxidase